MSCVLLCMHGNRNTILERKTETWSSLWYCCTPLGPGHHNTQTSVIYRNTSQNLKLNMPIFTSREKSLERWSKKNGCAKWRVPTLHSLCWVFQLSQRVSVESEGLFGLPASVVKWHVRDVLVPKVSNIHWVPKKKKPTDATHRIWGAATIPMLKFISTSKIHTVGSQQDESCRLPQRWQCLLASRCQ